MFSGETGDRVELRGDSVSLVLRRRLKGNVRKLHQSRQHRPVKGKADRSLL